MYDEQQPKTLNEEELNQFTGYIRIYRSLKKHWIWKASKKKTKAEAFIDMIMEANHQTIKEPIGYDLITIKRGQVLTSQEKLAKEWNWDRSVVRNFLEMLEQDRMVKIETTTKYTMITLCKYESYQGATPMKQQRPNNDTTSTQQRYNTNNNDNNYNNDNNTLEPKGSSAVPAGKQENPLRKEYKELEKNKSTIYKFILSQSPDFIEPYVDLWNVFADEKKLPKVVSVSKSRKKKFYVRLKEESFNYIEILRKAGKSDYVLSGKWFGFDWIIENDKNYLKVIEGNYDNGKEITEIPKAVEYYKTDYQKAIDRQKVLSGEN